MHRSVGVSVNDCAPSSGQDFGNLCVAKREGISILRDFAGIQGWHFILLIGGRRDEIMKSARKVTNEMIVTSFGVT